MKAIIYDLDGTLINSIEDLMDALQALIFRLGGEAVEREELFDLLEVGSRKLMEALESRPDGLTDVDLFEMFNNEYETRLWNKTEPYEGVREMLEAVAQRGCLQAVVTNKIDRLAQRVCAHFFPGVFELCIGTIPLPTKPDPTMLNMVMKDLGVDPSEVVYVGDTKGDMEAAEAAGILGVGVNWGYGGNFETKYLLKEPEDLIRLLDALK